MENGIIQHGSGTIIMNGGNPLEGCPKDWDEAKEIEERFNEGKDYSKENQWEGEPVWSFDCGFKLDFDGPIVRASSRFYPPKTHYGPTWDGSVSILFGEEELVSKEFNCPTLEELRTQVEEYVNEVKAKIKAAFK